MASLQNLGLPRQQLGLLKSLLHYCGTDKRVGDLYSSRTFTSRFATMAKHSLRVMPSAAISIMQAPVFLQYASQAVCDSKTIRSSQLISPSSVCLLEVYSLSALRSTLY